VQRESVSTDALRQLESEAARASSPLTRIHALNVLGGRDALTARILLTALRDPSAAVVREAARLCEDRAAQMPALAQALRHIVAHDDVLVRYQVALALGAFTGDDADAALAEIAARDINDAWVRAAVLTSSNGRAERVLAALLSTAPSSDERSQLVGQLVATALGDAPEQGVARILRTIAAPQRNGVQDWQILGLAACVDALERRKLDLAQLGESGNAELKRALAATEPLFAHARETVRNPQTPLDRRCGAAALLARGLNRQDDDRRLLVSLLGPHTPPDLQSAAVASLSRLRGEAVPGLLLSNWRSTEPRLRSEVLSALLSRDAWAKVLVARLAAGDIAVADLDAATRNRLGEHKNDDIRAAAATLLGAATTADRRKVLDDYGSVIETAGDAARGAEVFRKRCAACHQHQSIGADVGAKLASLQDKSAESLLTAILDPNRAVEAKYTGYSAATRDGRVVTGMIVEETATSITLAKSDGTRDVILRVDLDSLASSGKSFMPEGLEKDLAPQDVADVIAFVRSE
jgi:putative heme-binding domain-containing protein